MKDEDLKIESYPERRIGGQQVGVPPSGVRVTHLPTGLVACCSCERSQTKNRKVALSMLEWGLMEVGWKDSNPEGHGWFTEMPAVPGTYRMSCAENGHSPEEVLVEKLAGEKDLQARVDGLWRPLHHYHEGLSEVKWKRLR